MPVRDEQRGGRWARDGAALATLVALLASGPACFLVTSFDGLHADGSSGGGGPGGTGPGSATTTGTSHGHGGSGGGPASTSGSGASGTCSSGEVCTPPPDDGWSEPSVFVETADASASCAGTNLLLSGNTMPAPAVCAGCSCDPPLSCVALATACTDGGCSNCPGGPTIIPNAPCSPGGYTASYTRLVVQPSSGTTCKPRGSPTPPVVAWGTYDVLCAPGAIAGPCGGGGTCVEKPATGKVCVSKKGAGDACPAGYPDHHRIFEGADVTCDACTCDAATGTPNCALANGIQFYSDTACGVFVGSISTTGCTNGITGAGSAVYTPVDPGSCNARSAANVTPTKGVDVCCM